MLDIHDGIAAYRASETAGEALRALTKEKNEAAAQALAAAALQRRQTAAAWTTQKAKMGSKKPKGTDEDFGFLRQRGTSVPLTRGRRSRSPAATTAQPSTASRTTQPELTPKCRSPCHPATGTCTSTTFSTRSAGRSLGVLFSDDDSADDVVTHFRQALGATTTYVSPTYTLLHEPPKSRKDLQKETKHRRDAAKFSGKKKK